MDNVDVPIIACNNGLVFRDRDQTTPVKIVPTLRRPSTPGSNWKPGIVGRKSRDADKTSIGARIRSASAGRDPKSELTSRYWSYLFGNLERSISEIYDSCEKQDNVLQCREVLFILESYVRDFHNLIEWLHLKWSYEQTPPPMRPNALAWEIRKPSFSILPHTRAYEKLVGIVSNKGFTKTTDSILTSESSHQSSLSNVTSELSNDSIRLNDNPTIDLVLSETNQQSECVSMDNRVDVGLQTEIDDPDVYYFAGGRSIACQTDPCEQYEPLTLLASGPTPVIIVLDPLDSDNEASQILDVSFAENNATTTVRSTTTVTTDPIPATVESCVDTYNNSTNTATAVNTVVETKSSATQLSVGVLIEEAAENYVSTDGSGDCIPKSPKVEDKSEPEVKNVKTTFADKAKNGMMRQSIQAKSVPANMNKIGTCQPRSNSGCTRGKAPPPPSYRSNIASRYRAALNTNKQQVVSPVKSKLCQSISSSAGLSLSNSSSVTCKFNSISREQSNEQAKNVWNSKSSGQIKPPSSFSSTKRTTFTSNNVPKTLGPVNKSESAEKKKSGSVAARGTTPRTTDSDSKAGMVRSKSMINPPSTTTTLRVSPKSATDTRTRNGKRTDKPNPKQYLRKNVDSSTKNFVSLPDVSVHRKRNSTVDEDGWETVRTRSNRSKWSPSGSSLSIPLVSEMKNGICSNEPENGIESPDSETEKSVWKEVDVGAAEEEEEIKKKEEDLDNAIREEELIEEELRQVEKDFEMIENESRDDTTTSENDNAPSPDGMQLLEMDPEKEQFFFICMDDEAGAKAEDFPPREPGRIVALRDRLKSPAKRCDGAETFRKYQAKLAKAERNREKLLQAKYKQYVELSERFEALNETTKKLVSEREELISKAEARLKRATENRKQYLQNIVRKAHDEDAKAKEIAFINLLEAQNKRHDYLATAHEIEGRLQTIQEERRLKLEERATKVSSVIKRQLRIRHNWQSKLERMQEKRRKAEERISREKEEKAKERSELAQEKARDREERISALNAAKKAEKEELQKKIQQKQEDTARRHEENIEQIRQKAIELSIPRTQEDCASPPSTRVCTLCKVSLPSEVQELAHLRGKSHIEAARKVDNPPGSSGALESFGLRYVCDLQVDKIDFKVQVDKNRFKTLKKHCKKLMQKLLDNGSDFEKKEAGKNCPISFDPDQKAKLKKNIKELDRLLGLFENERGTPSIATSMDRLMTDLRKTSVKVKSAKEVVVNLGAIPVALRIMKCSANDLPDKLKLSACNLLIGILYDSLSNVVFCLRGTAICHILEFCAERLSTLIPEGTRWITGTSTEELPYDPVIESLLEVLFSIINIVPDPFHGIGKEGFLDKETLSDIKQRVLDIIGYLVASSVIDRFSIYCSAVRGPIENQPKVADLLKMVLDFLVMNIYAVEFCVRNNDFCGKKEVDTTQLLAAIESSELGGAVSMSYTLLLYQGAPCRPRVTPGNDENGDQPVPPPPGEKTASIVRSTLLLINALARLDHQVLQNVLGSEAVSLQFRHIASQLLWQVVPHRADGNMRRLLNELLIAIAYFTVGNRHNQVTIQSGQTPTVLQQLCTLPQEFFRDIKYIKILFPTLISATYGCPENIEILTQNNIDLQALNAFMQSHHAANSDILGKLKLTATSKISDEKVYPNGIVNGKQENMQMNGEKDVLVLNNRLMNGHTAEAVS